VIRRVTLNNKIKSNQIRNPRSGCGADLDSRGCCRSLAAQNSTNVRHSSNVKDTWAAWRGLSRMETQNLSVLHGPRKETHSGCALLSNVVVVVVFVVSYFSGLAREPENLSVEMKKIIGYRIAF
jgi:hypothetical protein